MKMKEVREVANRKGVEAGKMKKTELIKTVQRAEGNNDCFGTRHVDECNQLNCLWRKDCLDENRARSR